MRSVAARSGSRQVRLHSVATAVAILCTALLLSACGDKSPDVRGPDSIQWTGHGDWMVVTYLDADDTPCVAAVDPKTHEARVETGYTLAAIEPTGAVLWLEPTTAEDWRDIATGNRAWSGFMPVDSPPGELLAWDLRGQSGPSAAVPAKWTPLPGPDQWVAYLEVDALRGSRPSTLLFMDNTHRDEGHKAALPADFGTFRPIGWSPSGAYFAVEELAWVGDDTQVSPEIVPRGLDRRRVLVIEPASGSVAASTTIDVSVTSTAEWLGYEDSLVWLTARSEVGTLTAHGAMQFSPRGDSFPHPFPLDFETAESGFVADELFAVGDPGLMLRARGGQTDEVWLLDRAGPARVMRVDGAMSVAPSASAGVAVLRMESSDGKTTPVVSIAYGPSSPSEGQTEVEIWRGPARAFSAD